jgi:hypothetical protein
VPTEELATQVLRRVETLYLYPFIVILLACVFHDLIHSLFPADLSTVIMMYALSGRLSCSI